MSGVLQRPRTDRGFLGQPRALANLFGVEAWERFSFYGMQGILLIYLYHSVARGGLGLDQGTATSVVGAYGGTVYLSTVVGAWLADRVLGPERVLFAGGVVVLAGHVALAVLPGVAGVGVGLVLVALGSGGVKANATTLVGTLYAEGDERRDAGFSLFYLGINLGGLVGPLLTGLLRDTAGFHWGFGLAALGMAAGLVQYAAGRRHLPAHARSVPDPLPAGRGRRTALGALAAAAVLAVLCLLGVVTAERLDELVVALTVAASVALFALVLGSARTTAAERRRVLGFVPLFLSSVAFWALFQQQFTVVAVYSDQRLDRSVLGWQVPVAWVQSVNPVFIVLLAPVFAALWTRLGPRQPSTPVKFALGTALMGVAFLLFLPMAGGGPGSAPLAGLVGILLVFTLAELSLSPVGLSVTTKLAPAAFRAQLVALFFLSTALGTALSGTLAGYYSPEAEHGYFGVLGGTAVALGVLLALASPWVRRLTHPVR
ncbi:peptide MFS transporter [Kineococcus sp. SYSU DK005]|uniref:peptide MFS transporter n=1 Tax=Kineococcus sp. SYSU DK005 TaxID=3383126 RepID=UPI003D7E53DD